MKHRLPVDDTTDVAMTAIRALNPPRAKVAKGSRGNLQYILMLDRNIVRELLFPFDISVSEETIDRLLLYLDLLIRWNRKINLTAIGAPEECVTRHFGESFIISSAVPLNGRLLDIGSGAGFPGLAAKLIAPDLKVVLLEPVAKKRAFLKEVVRACGMSSVQVFGERLDGFAHTQEPPSFDLITTRAVGGLESLVPKATVLLKSGGHLCLWVGGHQIRGIREANPDLEWQNPLRIPLSHNRFILTGMHL
jgi:16S rRNA (guanine527-N7)-methyltransferase